MTTLESWRALNDYIYSGKAYYDYEIYIDGLKEDIKVVNYNLNGSDNSVSVPFGNIFAQYITIILEGRLLSAGQQIFIRLKPKEYDTYIDVGAYYVKGEPAVTGDNYTYTAYDKSIYFDIPADFLDIAEPSHDCNLDNIADNTVSCDMVEIAKECATVLGCTMDDLNVGWPNSQYTTIEVSRYQHMRVYGGNYEQTYQINDIKKTKVSTIFQYIAILSGINFYVSASLIDGAVKETLVAEKPYSRSIEELVYDGGTRLLDVYVPSEETTLMSKGDKLTSVESSMVYSALLKYKVYSSPVEKPVETEEDTLYTEEELEESIVVTENKDVITLELPFVIRKALKESVNQAIHDALQSINARMAKFSKYNFTIIGDPRLRLGMYLNIGKYKCYIAGLSYSFDGGIQMNISSGNPENNEIVMSRNTLSSIAAAVNNLQIDMNKATYNTLTVGEFFAKTGEFGFLKTDELEAEAAKLNWVEILGGKISNAMIMDSAISGSKITDSTLSGIKITDASIDLEKVGKSFIEDLTATDAFINSAIINELISAKADITDLIFGTAGGTSITTEFANSVVSVIGDAQIESAMIKGLAVEKLLSGTIYTNNINIQSEDGGMKIVGNTQQFKDASGKIRMQMGQDGNGDFSMSIFGTDGKTAVLTDKGLATADAIPDGLIKNVKIADDANISAGKLDIASLFTTMNADNTHTLHSSIIMFDETNQSLNVALSQMSSNIETLTNVAYGQVVTYNTDVVPTLNNYPAYDWVIPVYPSDTLYPSDELIFKYGYEEYVKHVGAVCYMKDSTDSYRFCMADDGTFYWKLIEDSETAVLNTKVAALEVSTSGISSQVSSMSQTISAQGSTLTTLASEISQNESDIALRVLETTYNNGMAGKSNKASILSEINLSTEGVKIKADRLNLDGLVTITNLSNGSTIVDGSCVKTGTISADRLDITDLFSRNITATNFNMRGGTIDISTNDALYSSITINSNCNSMELSSCGMTTYQTVSSGSGEYKIVEANYNGGAEFVYRTGKLANDPVERISIIGDSIVGYDETFDGKTSNKTWSISTQSGVAIFTKCCIGNKNNEVVYSDNSIASLQYVNNGSTTYMQANTNHGAYGINWWASDTRLKENIEKTEQTALDKINKINFIQFDWKSNKEHEILGVSANQLEEIMPDVVYRVEQPEDAEYDFLRNIDTGKMTTYAMKAIQELSQVVKQQNERIEKLESMIQKGTVD